MSLRIAVLAHIRFPIAMPFPGGMEAHSWHLARGLIARGHDVALLASGDSDPILPIHPILVRHYEAATPWAHWAGSPRFAHMQRAAFREAQRAIDAGGFDVVHNNTLHHRPHLHARARRQPMVTSLHVPPFKRLARAVRRATAPWMHVTATSRRHLASYWPSADAPPTAHVVHNGVDLARLSFVRQGNSEAVWAGRITPNKGTGEAVRAALSAGIALTLFGPVEDPAYFDAEVRPHLGDRIRYGGFLDSAALGREIGRASVCLFTPLWDEPFGLVAAEAMACGVPVAAFDSGAAREVIGPCGCYAVPGDVAGLADAIARAAALPRHAARARAETFFSLDVMLDAYEALYAEAIAGAGAPRPDHSPDSSSARMADVLA